MITIETTSGEVRKIPEGSVICGESIKSITIDCEDVSVDLFKSETSKVKFEKWITESLMTKFPPPTH